MHQRTWLSLLTLPLVAALTYPMVLRQGASLPKPEVKPGSQDPLAGLSDIQDVLARVREDYVDPVDMDKLLGGGIQGALERLHPMNAYLGPEELRQGDPGPADAGLLLVKRGLYAQVLHVVPGGPGAKAGLQVGDILRKLDGESVGAMSAWQLERRLRGKAGSELVLLRYAGQSGELKKIVVTRELPQRPALTCRVDKAVLVAVPDLSAGRAQELKALLAGQDRRLPLVLDLRQCAGGELQEAAQVAGLFGAAGTLATVQEAGKGDVAVPVVADPQPAFTKCAVLAGMGTVGAPEAVAAALKKAGLPVLGERTAALGVGRTRFLLRQGGAVELVNRRWLGASGEKLGTSGEKLDRTVGLAPTTPLRGLRPDEDPLPRVLAELEGRKAEAPKAKGPERAKAAKPDKPLDNKKSSLEGLPLLPGATPAPELA